jgi:hypothetical protein
LFNLVHRSGSGWHLCARVVAARRPVSDGGMGRNYSNPDKNGPPGLTLQASSSSPRVGSSTASPFRSSATRAYGSCQIGNTASLPVRTRCSRNNACGGKERVVQPPPFPSRNRSNSDLSGRSGCVPPKCPSPPAPCCLGGEAQLPDILQNLPKSRFRREAHSSTIRIQEGKPNLTFGQIAPSIAHCLRRDDGGFCQQTKGWRKMAPTSPFSQVQFDSTKLSRRRFWRGSCRSNNRWEVTCHKESSGHLLPLTRRTRRSFPRSGVRAASRRTSLLK